MLNAAPVLRVSDLASALAFYRDVLGFTVEFEYEDYVILEIDQSPVHLASPAVGKPSGGGTVYVFCEEVDEYFGKICARGAKPAYEPCPRFYLMRDLMINRTAIS